MKIQMILALVGLIAAVVSAHSSEDNSRDGDRYPKRCVCGTQCARNVGLRNLACRKSRTQYLQCVDTVCSSQTCAAEELFNATSGVCEKCPEGLHVDATKSRCVCNNGTTPDFKTRTCVSCPKDSIQTADKCYCSPKTAYNRVDDACQPCPANSIKTGKDCRCTITKQFWNEGAFACQPCPGSWTTVTKTERKRQYTIEVCTCPDASHVFNEETVSCAPCPANSNLVIGTYGNYCSCTLVGQEYDDDTNTCVDRYRQDSDDSSSQFY